MLSMLEVTGPRGTNIQLPIGQIVEGVMIASIDGLQPVKASISTSKFASIPGERPQASRREKRNIMLNLRLEPFYGGLTVFEIRQRLYEFFMPESFVKLNFTMQNGLTVNIEGQIEDFDTELFVQEPYASISILCFEPDFIDPTLITGSISSTSSRDQTEYIYDGTIPTGLKFSAVVAGSVPNGLSIEHTDAHGKKTNMVLDMPFYADDRIYINTNIGEKEILVTRGSAARSYLYSMTPGSDWIQLQPGSNFFRFYVGTLFPFSLNLSYQNRYGGL